MTLVESLPSRPLSPKELTDLNAADAFELAVSVEDEDEAESLLVATESWVKGLVFDATASEWRVVETVTLDGETRRIDGLQACEDAVLAYRHESAADAD
jgi:hypothetical protein